jgi:D-sedoheptulose 7-phosphate isomerase
MLLNFYTLNYKKNTKCKLFNSPRIISSISLMSIYLHNLKEHIALISMMHSLDEEVLEVGSLAAQTLQTGGKILFCGNGGSASDSQHLAAELTGRFIKDRKPLGAIALTTDTSALTSIANDFAFEDVFARQVMALGRSGDLLVGISTSGNSKNIIRAVEEARALGMRTVGLLGRDGGQLRALCDHVIVVPSDVTARIQEAHILIGHTFCGLIEQHLGLA